MNAVTPIRVFISSPGDLAPERAVVNTVLDELNRSPVFRDRYKLMAYAWELGTPPVIGAQAQDLVDTYLLHPADCDIMICLLWLRMGLPQQRTDPATQLPYQSGTEYEILTAYRAHQARGRPLILLYRCTREAPDPAAVDQEQAGRLSAFFNRFNPGGDLQGLIGSFADPNQLRDKLRYDLTLLIQRNFIAQSGTETVRRTPHPLKLARITPPSAPRRPRVVQETPRHNLPAQVTPLIGRVDEVTDVCDRLRRADVRVLTLTGPGGIGKTRLAIQVATELLEQFANAVCFVDLAAIHDASLAASTIAQTLGVQEGSDQSLMQLLKAYLRNRQLLLVLDSFEHILDAAQQVAELIAGAPQLKVLITSREVLHLYGEHEFVVPPLAVPEPIHRLTLDRLTQYDAVRLFVECAQAVQSTFVVSEANAPIIAEICRRLDGLPLAIELAAARIKLFSPNALLARLSNRFMLLTGGARTLPTRQQTLRNTMAWSFALLSASECTLFTRLSVFVGGCTHETVEMVCGSIGGLMDDVLGGLEQLVRKSLVRLSANEQGEPRFTMLETIREYAHEQLAARDELATMQREYAAYFIALVESAEPYLRGANQLEWIAHLEAEYLNIRAVLTWCFGDAGDPALGLQLVGALGWFWWVRNHYTEGWHWLTIALNRDLPLVPSLRARALVTASLIALGVGEHQQGTLWANEALGLYRQLVDDRGVSYVLGVLGAHKAYQGNERDATDLWQEGLRVARGAGHDWMIVTHLRQLGWISQDEAAALHLNEAALQLGRHIGDRWTLSLIALNLGTRLAAHSDYTRAQEHFEQGLRSARELGDSGTVANILVRFAVMQIMQGNYTRSAALLAEAQGLARTIGSAQISALALRVLGDLARIRSQYDAAETQYHESLALFRNINNLIDVGWTVLRLGFLALLQGKASLAQHWLNEVPVLPERHSSPEYRVVWMMLTAGIAHARGDRQAAARLLGSVAAHQTAHPAVYHPTTPIDYAQIVNEVQAALDQAIYQRAWLSGQALSIEQALAEAHSVRLGVHGLRSESDGR